MFYVLCLISNTKKTGRFLQQALGISTKDGKYIEYTALLHSLFIFYLPNACNEDAEAIITFTTRCFTSKSAFLLHISCRSNYLFSS